MNKLLPYIVNINIDKAHRRLIKHFILTALALLLLWDHPISSQITTKAWHLFSIFIILIVSIVTKLMPMGTLSIFAIALCTITKTITLKQALSNFSSPTIWLTITAFFLARGFIKTGLGTRVAYYFIYIVGRSTLGLGYGLVATDFLLSPFIPSNTARGGGIIFPIVSSICKDYNSCPKQGTERKIGAYLVKVAFQANVITSAMFMTAMAANSIMADFARSFEIKLTWETWAKATIVPGLINLILLPLIIYYIFPPEIKKTVEAQSAAKNKLREMGRLSFAETIMLFTFILLLFLWTVGDRLGIEPGTAAFCGLGILLLFDIINWDDILGEKNGWNTFIWLGTLLMMSTYLTEFGMMQWFSDQVKTLIFGYQWQSALIILTLIYFYIHYLFASLTAHITALYSAFLLVALATSAPGILSAIVFAVASNLCASITHYGSGPAPVFFGANFMSVRAWWTIGGIISLANLAIWFVIGGIWWKFLGLF